MRRCASAFLIAFIIACTMQPYAFAQTKVYALDGYLEIFLPEDLWVVTEDTPQDAPVFELMGVSKDELIGRYEQTTVCMIAWSHDFEEYFGLNVMQSDMAEFSGANDTVLNALMLVIRMSSGLLDMDIHEHEIYEHAQTRFLKFFYTDTKNGAEGAQYVTQHGGITYYFNFYSCTDKPDDDSMNAVIDSIVFEYDPK